MSILSTKRQMSPNAAPPSRPTLFKRAAGSVLILAGLCLFALMVTAGVSELILGDFFAVWVCLLTTIFALQLIDMGRRTFSDERRIPVKDPLAALWRHPHSIHPFGSYPKFKFNGR